MKIPFIENNFSVNEEQSCCYPVLNSSEISNLWNTYMNVDMISVFTKHLYQNVEDSDIKPLVGEAVQLYEQRASDIKNIMEHDNLLIPKAFTKEDIALGAPRLYSDIFCIYYLFCLERFIMPRNALILGLLTRNDVRDVFKKSIVSSIDYFNKVANTLLNKGLYIRFPNVTISQTNDFVKQQKFLTGFLGEKRPSLAQEIATSFHIVFLNSVGKNLMTGFRQVAKTKQVRNYIDRGINLSDKIIDKFSSHLKEEDIPVPMFWDNMVTDSIEPPISDKLMMFHIGLISSCGAMEYAFLMTLNFRHDLKAKYLQIMIEAGKFAEDGINIMIENGWLEEPPRIIDRKKVANKMH